MAVRTIISCCETQDPKWIWFEGQLSKINTRIEMVRAIPCNLLERRIKRINLPRPRAAFEAVRTAKNTEAIAIVAHGPAITAWCGFFARLLRVDIPILGHYFNMGDQVLGAAKRRGFAWMLSRVTRIVVLSTFERDSYAEAFCLPRDRFDVLLWGIRPPEAELPETPLEPGEYVCAIGGVGRDYATLIEVARRLPQIRFVLVVRPFSLRGLDLPSNVKVHVNLPLGKTMNILMHSRFMALALVHNRMASGHVTLVSAMHLGKAFVVTDSAGVSDYVAGAEHGLLVAPNAPSEFANVVERLWNDPVLCRQYGENGRRFARARCTEDQVFEHFRHWLNDTVLAA
jgi:glycosyltransferase involved in cell wall biosynthesis